MPRFFFDTHDGDHVTIDENGLQFQDIEAAKDEAKKTLPDIVRDEMPDGDRRDFVIIIRNGAGEGIFQVTLTLAVEPLP